MDLSPFRRLILTTAKCRFCGESFDSTLKKGKSRGGKRGKKKELRTIAVYQKYLIICVLIELVAYIGFIIASVAAGAPTPRGPALAVAILFLLVLLVFSLAGMVMACLLENKVYNIAAVILLVILSFIPCLGLIALLVVNGKATPILRDKGYDVGFLGADLSDF